MEEKEKQKTSADVLAEKIRLGMMAVARANSSDAEEEARTRKDAIVVAFENLCCYTASCGLNPFEYFGAGFMRSIQADLEADIDRQMLELVEEAEPGTEDLNG